MRHIVRFLLCPDSFWSLLMIANYSPWIMITDIEPAQNSSFMWREISSYAMGVMTKIL